MFDIEFPSRLILAQTPTPFYCLERLSAQVGGPRIWIKRDDLTECTASGNKIRKLEYVLARVKEADCDTVITSGGLQSNHCRATALLGARLGFKVHLLLRDEHSHKDRPDGNLLLDYLAGAEVSIYSKFQFQQQHAELLAQWVQHYEAQGNKPWVIPVGASDGHGVWGYIHCAKELKSDFDAVGISPEKLFHATGSGGTQAGLTLGASLFDLNCEIVGMAVCDSESYFKKKVREDMSHWHVLYGSHLDERFSVDTIAVNVNDHYIGSGYGIASEQVFSTIKLLAQTEGIILDPVYSGKAFDGMLSEIRKGHLDGLSDVVFIHTGGIFGLMAQSDKLDFTRS